MAATLDIIIANSDPNDSINVRHKPSEPIFFLLKRIHARFGTNESSVSRQELFLNGMRLKDYNQTMEYYRIFGNTLTYRPIPFIPSLDHAEENVTIYIKSLTGKMVTISCTSGATIDHIKQLVEDQEGIPQTSSGLSLLASSSRMAGGLLLQNSRQSDYPFGHATARGRVSPWDDVLRRF